MKRAITLRLVRAVEDSLSDVLKGQNVVRAKPRKVVLCRGSSVQMENMSTLTMDENLIRKQMCIYISMKLGET